MFLNHHLFSNDPSHEVVVSQNLEREVVRLSGVTGLVLHDLEDLVTGLCAVAGLAVDGDGFLHHPHVFFPVDVDPRPGQLCDFPDFVTGPADDGTNHLRVDKNTEREVHRTPGIFLLVAAKQKLVKWPHITNIPNAPVTITR